MKLNRHKRERRKKRGFLEIDPGRQPDFLIPLSASAARASHFPSSSSFGTPSPPPFQSF